MPRAAKLPAVTAAHDKLTKIALPAAIEVFTETMALDPWEEKTNPETGDVVRTFNSRINSQRIRSAGLVLQAVVHLGDQALKRQAGGQLKKLLELARAERPELFAKHKGAVIDQPAPHPAPTEHP